MDLKNIFRIQEILTKNGQFKNEANLPFHVLSLLALLNDKPKMTTAQLADHFDWKRDRTLILIRRLYHGMHGYPTWLERVELGTVNRKMQYGYQLNKEGRSIVSRIKRWK